MSLLNSKGVSAVLLTTLMSVLPSIVMADELNGADTAWILTSTALVLFMTIPGLALFYAGLVRSRQPTSQKDNKVGFLDPSVDEVMAWMDAHDVEFATALSRNQKLNVREGDCGMALGPGAMLSSIK